MLWTTLGSALFIFVLRLADVSLGTLRTMMIMRGMRYRAALLGFVEVTIWVVAISQVLGHLDTIWNVIGYSSGFAAGILSGMWLENKLALGYLDIRIVSLTKGPEIVQKVRQAGYGATQVQAEGRSGPVYLIDIVAPRKQVAAILQLAREVDATSFVTVDEARQVIGGYQRLGK